MRRYTKPYNGKRYLLNKNTNELHDLEKECDQCQIDEIKVEHIVMCETEMDGILYQTMVMRKVNGCYWCNRNNHSG